MSDLLQRMDLRPLRWHPSPHPALRWRTEMMWFLCAYLVYWTARWVFVGDTKTAQANAALIWNLEKATRIAIELSVQRALDFDAANTVLSNLYLVSCA